MDFEQNLRAAVRLSALKCFSAMAKQRRASSLLLSITCRREGKDKGRGEGEMGVGEEAVDVEV